MVAVEIESTCGSKSIGLEDRPADKAAAHFFDLAGLPGNIVVFGHWSGKKLTIMPFSSKMKKK